MVRSGRIADVTKGHTLMECPFIADIGAALRPHDSSMRRA